jgi:hypothetical protein
VQAETELSEARAISEELSNECSSLKSKARKQKLANDADLNDSILVGSLSLVGDLAVLCRCL